MRKDFRPAIDDCRRALHLDPNYVKAYARAGKCFLGLGEFTEAGRQLAQAKAVEPDNKAIDQDLEAIKKAEYHLRMATEALTKKDYRLAIFNADEALKVSPGCPELYLVIVKAYIGQKNFGEATRVAKQVTPPSLLLLLLRLALSFLSLFSK